MLSAYCNFIDTIYNKSDCLLNNTIELQACTSLKIQLLIVLPIQYTVYMLQFHF